MGFSIDIATQDGVAPITPDKQTGATAVAPKSAAQAGTVLSNAVPPAIAFGGQAGDDNAAARADHTHDHGTHADPTDHATATAAGAGFMSAADKIKLDAATPNATPDTLVMRDSTGRAQIGWPHSTNSPNTTLEQFLHRMHSPGLLSGGQFSSVAGPLLRVAAGTGLVRPTDDDVSDLTLVNWPQADVSIPNDSSTRHIGVRLTGDANGAEVVVKTSFDFDKDTEWPLGTAVQIGGVIYHFYNPYRVADPITNIIQRFDGQDIAIRDSFLGGLIISGTGTRNIKVTAGKIWARINDNDFPGLDTSITGGFGTVYTSTSGASWTYSAGPTVTQWPNTQYNDPAVGLVTLGNNRWANLWFYVALNGSVVLMLYGQQEHLNQSAALLEGPPSLTPANLPFQAMLLGRVTFEKNATTATFTSAFASVPFSLTPITDHGSLGGLTDDDHTQYHNDARGDARYLQLTGGTLTGAAEVSSASGVGFRRVVGAGSGLVANSNNDDVVVDAAGNGGMTILVPAGGVGAFNIGTPASNVACRFVFSESTGTLTITAASTTKVQMTSTLTTLTGNVSVGGDITAATVNGGALASGTYTPTLTAVANIAATTSNSNWSYIRVGNVVTVTGQGSFDPTAAGVQTQVRISLPVASNLTSGSQLSGIATRGGAGTVVDLSASILGATATDDALLSFMSDADVVSRGWLVQFQYLVV